MWSVNTQLCICNIVFNNYDVPGPLLTCSILFDFSQLPSELCCIIPFFFPMRKLRLSEFKPFEKLIHCFGLYLLGFKANTPFFVAHYKEPHL